jgi:RNA polymerase sigma factor (sigma-70 family)
MSPSVSARLLLTQSDARLVAFAHAGHERAFEALVQRYRRPLLGYCRRLLLSQERAEDALQQALLQAWLALRAGTEVVDVKPWLYQIVHNAALNALRVSGYDYCKLSETLSGADAPQADLDRRIAVREALAGLAALPEMQREALLRTAVEGRTHQQVARDLGLSENALRGLVYRARATLRAAASAIVPPPLVSWALGSGGRGAPALERLAELGAGGGSAGVAGLLMKGGAVAVTASVLAGGIAAVHAHPKVTTGHSAAQVARHLAHPAMMPVALAAARSASVVPAPDSRRAPSDRKPPPTRRPGPRHNRVGGQPSTVPLGTAIAPPPHLAPSSTRGSGDGQGRTNGGGGDHNEAQSPSSGGLATGATATSGGDGGHGSGHGEQGSDGGGSSREGASGSSSREGASGSSSREGASGSSSANSQDAAFGGSPGDLSTNASQPGESHDRQDPSEASSSTSTNSSSKDEPSLTSGG